MIAHRFRGDVFVAARHPFDRMNMDAAFVGKSGLAHPRLARVMP